MAARRIGNRGQSTAEVALMFALVIAGLVAMATYLQRSVQGGVRANSDSLGTQFSVNSAWNSQTLSNSHEDQAQVLSNQNSTYNQSMQ